MNFSGNHVRHRGINELVSPYSAQSGKCMGLDLDREVAGSVPRARMSRMQCAVVPDAYRRGTQCGLQASADTCHALGGQGSTCMKGLTSCDWKTPLVT